MARERTRPGADDGLLLIARRAADLVCEVFGPDGIPAFCGHPEVETALAELARVTGDARYAEQAALFVAGAGTRRSPTSSGVAGTSRTTSRSAMPRR